MASFFGLIALLVLFCASITSAQDPFTLGNATRALMYSYSSYCGPDDLTNWTCYWCTKVPGVPMVKVSNIFQNESEATLGFAGVTENFILFSFRGTVLTDIANWVTDIGSEVLVPYPTFHGCQVAAGFYDAYQGVQQQVISAAKQLRQENPDLPFLFTGHSLGAALALFSVADVYSELNEPPSSMITYNFGDPRVGDEAFTQKLNQILGTSWRVINKADIVPHLPLIAMGFNHTATEVWFPNDDEEDYQLCPGGEDNDACADGIPFFELNVFDHLSYLGYEQLEGLLFGCR